MYNWLILLFTIVLVSGCAKPEQVIEKAVFYPALPNQPRLQYLFTINSEDDIKDEKSSFIKFLIGNVESEKKLKKPYDVSSTKGKIYVLDRGYKNLLCIDLNTREFLPLDDAGMGKLQEPSGIWVTPDGVKYITDMKRKQVIVFDQNDNYLRSYGDEDLFDKPVDVAVQGNRVYVCDMGKNEVSILNKTTGRLLNTINQIREEKTKLHKPSHISLDSNGDLFVNDAFNYKVRKFDASGRYLQSIGYHGDTTGAFARPKGLELDQKGHLYVVDSAYENVQIFDSFTGQLLLYFGGGDSRRGSMYLPASVHIDYENVEYFTNFTHEDFQLEYVVYVGNMFGSSSLNVYGFGEWSGPFITGEADGKTNTENFEEPQG